MEKIRLKLKSIRNEKGAANILTLVMTLAVLTMLMVMLEFYKVYVVTAGAKKNIKLAADSYIMSEAAVIFDSLKGGHEYTGEIDYVKFEELLIQQTGTEEVDGSYVKNENGNTLYILDGENIEFSVDEHYLKIKINYTVNVPVKGIITTGIPIRVRSDYVLKEE